jgi:hypothetical protein
MPKIDQLTKALLGLLVIGCWGLLIRSVLPGPLSQEQDDARSNSAESQLPPIIKARGLVIVDEQGRERIILGAPMPDPPLEGKRINPSHGMMILDAKGYERFGVGLMDNGQMGMGFDAPRGTGDDRNRERIMLIADPQGGASIRFLNRKTGVIGWLRLGDDDQLYLEFIDVQKDQNKVIKRQLGLHGEKTTEEPFK